MTVTLPVWTTGGTSQAGLGPGYSPASPVEKTLLDTVTLSSGTLAQSPEARQPFMGKLMSVAPLAGSLWMLRTGGGMGEDRPHARHAQSWGSHTPTFPTTDPLPT